MTGSIIILANVPISKSSVSLSITTSGVDTLIAGESYSLECSVNGATDQATYRWLKGPASSRMQLTNTSWLLFSPLRASDAGPYTCQVIVGTNIIAVEGHYTISPVRRKYNFNNIIIISLESGHACSLHSRIINYNTATN